MTADSVDSPRHKNGTTRISLGWRMLLVAVKRTNRPSGARRGWLLAAALPVIFCWQLLFAVNSGVLDATFRNAAASGMHDDARFFYFLYYLRLFPVATTSEAPPAFSEAASRSFLETHAGTLVQDLNWTWFEGDRGKINLYWLDAWLKGEPRDPSVRPFNRLAFTTALGALFFSFWWLGYPLLGTVTVLLVGSNPFQLYEVHVRENVHGWTITTALLVLALHLPALTRRALDRRYLWLLPLATGILLATVRTVRSEPTSIAVAAALTYACLFRQPWWRRAVMIGLLAGAFGLANAAWNRWFLYKHEEAKAVLTELGGHPFPGPIRAHHAVWHPIWCGLGDYGRKHGYTWNDDAALAYAAPILEREYGQRAPLNTHAKGLAPEEYWDAKQMYKKLPFDVPHYADVLRAKILGDIAADPLWYAGVLARRAWRVLFETTPARVSAGSAWVTVPFHGLIGLPLAVLLLAARSRFLLGLLLFTLPACFPALLVFSGLGMTYYGVYHLFALAIVVALVVEIARRSTARGRGLRRR